MLQSFTRPEMKFGGMQTVVLFLV